MEEEARAVLRVAALTAPGLRDLRAAIRARFAPLGGVELGHHIPPREGGRLVSFADWPDDVDDAEPTRQG